MTTSATATGGTQGGEPQGGEPQGGEPQGGGGLARLIAVMARLRDPDHGCPWDLEQSLDSLKPYMVEETYEALDAIDALGPAARATAADPMVTALVDPSRIADHRDELGDVLLQVAFQARLAEEFGWFTADDVGHAIAAKMERRHPHVFARDTADSPTLTSANVVTQWQEIKATEGKTSLRNGVLAGIPRQMPALLRGQRIGEKAAHVGFDWPDVHGALAKVDEELAELRAALTGGRPTEIEHELGDLLLALTSVARHAEVDAEQALRTTLDRFQGRFEHIEAHIAAHPTTPDLATLERWWQTAKATQAAQASRAGQPAQTAETERD